MGFGLVRWGTAAGDGIDGGLAAVWELAGTVLAGNARSWSQTRARSACGNVGGVDGDFCLCFRFTNVAFTWYVMIGAVVTFRGGGRELVGFARAVEV